MTGNGQTLEQQAARGVEAISQIITERDHLRVENERQRVDLSLKTEKCEQLDGRLAQMTAERDHYMRYCTELTTKLNDIQMLVVTTIEAAKHAAYKPPAVRPRPKISLGEVDAKGIESLIARLPKNGGDATNP